MDRAGKGVCEVLGDLWLGDLEMNEGMMGIAIA